MLNLGTEDLIYPFNSRLHCFWAYSAILASGVIGVLYLIGDSEKDIMAAKNAGIDLGLFFPPRHEVFYDKNALLALKPTYVIVNHNEILE